VLNAWRSTRSPHRLCMCTMKRQFGYLLCLVLVSVSALVSEAGEWKIWADLDLGGVSGKYLSGTVKQSLRWREDVDGLSSYFVDGNVTLRTLPWLNLAGAYRYIRAKSGGDWIVEARPYADAVLKVRWGKVSFSDRNRFEWREIESKDGEFRYRNKLTALYGDEGFTSLHFRPYAAVEAFLNEGNQDIFNSNRYRLTLGVRGDPEDHINHLIKHSKASRYKGDIFFTFESTRAGDVWIDSCIVGTKLGVFF
jgi:hypothetical protein